MNKAVFLDRDGVINKEINLLNNINQLEILSNVNKAIKILNDLGFYVIIVTNQPQVARGLLTEKEVEEINNHLEKLLEDGGRR